MKTYEIEEKVLNSKKNGTMIVTAICSLSLILNLFLFFSTSEIGNLTIVFGMISIISFQVSGLSAFVGNYFTLEGTIFSHYVRGAIGEVYDLREVKFEVIRDGDNAIYLFIDKNGKKMKYQSYLSASTFAEMVEDIKSVYSENNIEILNN